MPESLPTPIFKEKRFMKVEEPLFRPGEIHVWKANLEFQGERQAEYQSYLADDEKKRSERLKFKDLQQRFITSHAITRLILAQYLGQAPGEIEIRIKKDGKPVVVGPPGELHKHLFFNLSHSGSILLVSVSRYCDTGIDIEKIEPEFEHGLVSNHFFSGKERAWLESQQADQKNASFFQLWTCKEAVLKAEGEGIRRNLEGVQIAFGPETGTAGAILADGLDSMRTWSIKVFEPAAGYTAALAFENDASAAEYPKLAYYQWTG